MQLFNALKYLIRQHRITQRTKTFDRNGPLYFTGVSNIADAGLCK